jgi:hypothetical protein
MPMKRAAARVLAALAMFAAIISPSALGPGSYVAGGEHSAAIVNVASTTSSSVSIFTYHDC